jgi:hypothetical protein
MTMNTVSMLNRAQRILIATVVLVLAAAFAISAAQGVSAAGHDQSGTTQAKTKEWKTSTNVVLAATKEWKTTTRVN